MDDMSDALAGFQRGPKDRPLTDEELSERIEAFHRYIAARVKAMYADTFGADERAGL